MKPNAVPTFGIRIAPALKDAGIRLRNIKAKSVIDTPPWTLNKPEVIFFHSLQIRKMMTLMHSYLKPNFKK